MIFVFDLYEFGFVGLFCDFDFVVVVVPGKSSIWFELGYVVKLFICFTYFLYFCVVTLKSLCMWDVGFVGYCE